MTTLFKNSQHIVRIAGLFLFGLVLFVLLRAVFIPKGFGEFGHYRSGALKDNQSKPVVHAGRKACLECHTDVEEAQKGSRHATVSCEVCHGPQAAHAVAADPSIQKPKKPEAADVTRHCLLCHEANVARPKGFKQVESKAHMGGKTCIECHAHHAPQRIKGVTIAAAPAAAPAAAKEVKK